MWLLVTSKTEGETHIERHHSDSNIFGCFPVDFGQFKPRMVFLLPRVEGVAWFERYIIFTGVCKKLLE